MNSMGIYLSRPNKTKKTIEGKESFFSYAISSMQGWRTSMEDSHIYNLNLTNNLSIFGVFDGHGGREVATFVEKHFTQNLTNNQNFIKQDYQKALIENFLLMDELMKNPDGQKELKSLRPKNQPDSSAGCTANVCIINKDEIIIANAGDSRAVLYSKNQAISLSKDHKPQLLNETRRIHKAGGMIQDGRVNGILNLSRAFGDFEFKKNKKLSAEQQMITALPDIQRKNLIKDDQFLIIGCDGIWEMMSNDEICKYIKNKLNKGEKLTQIVEDFLDKNCAQNTINGKGCDNMSIILIVFQ